MPRQSRPPDNPPEPPDRPIDEAVLLGYLLLRAPHPDAIAAIKSDLFSNLGHRLTLAAINQVRNGGTEPCPIAVAALLERAGDLETAGGRGYLCSLIDGVVGGPAGWKMLAPYLDAVRGVARKRKLGLMAADLASAATNGHNAEDVGRMAGEIAQLAASDDGNVGLPWIDLGATPEPGRWLVRSIIPEQGRLLLVAPSGVGKSWVLEDLALSVAIGTPWLGQEDYRVQGNKGPVLIVDEESAASRIRYRLSRLAAGRGLELKDLSESVYVSCLAGVNVGDPRTWGLLLADVRRLRPCLVIIDAAIRVITGDENTAEAVGAFWRSIGTLQELGTAVAVAHHTGWMETGRPRGSADWKGGADAVIVLSKTDTRDRIKLSWAKLKDPPDSTDPDPIWVDRDITKTDATLTCGGVVDAADLPPTDRASAILEHIATGPDNHRRCLDVKAYFVGGGMSERTFFRTIATLKSTGKLTTDGENYKA